MSNKLSEVGNIVFPKKGLVTKAQDKLYSGISTVKSTVRKVTGQPDPNYHLKVCGIILLLAFLGLNIFTYLKEGVNAITYFL